MLNVEIINKAASCVLLIAISLLSGCEQSDILSGREITRLPDEPPRPIKESKQQLYSTVPVYSTAPVVSYNFDTNTNKGILKVDINNKGMEVRHSVVEHISDICSSHNVTLEAGKAPPVGARYEILNESVDNGIFTIEFRALY